MNKIGNQLHLNFIKCVLVQLLLGTALVEAQSDSAELDLTAEIVTRVDSMGRAAGQRSKDLAPKWTSEDGLALRTSLQEGDIAKARDHLRQMATNQTPDYHPLEIRECHALMDLLGGFAEASRKKVEALARQTLADQGQSGNEQARYLRARIYSEQLQDSDAAAELYWTVLKPLLRTKRIPSSAKELRSRFKRRGGEDAATTAQRLSFRRLHDLMLVRERHGMEPGAHFRFMNATTLN